MNGFERFNINTVSPTMLAQWDAAPATLILKRVYGVKTKANVNMWRGDAVEAGILFYLHNAGREDALLNAKRHAVDTFWQRADGEVSDEAEAASELIPSMVEQGAEFAGGIDSRLMASQLVADGFLEDIAPPFWGKMDFVFEDKTIVELKTTTRCPSKIETCSLSHRWQAATYATLRNAPVTLLYVTPKKFAAFFVGPNDPCLKTMVYSAWSMESALRKCEDGESLLRSLNPAVDSFYWDEETLDAYSRAISGEIRPLSGPGTEELAAMGYVTFGKHAGKHIEELPAKYLDWLLNPKLSDGGEYAVPEELQCAIRELRAKL